MGARVARQARAGKRALQDGIPRPAVPAARWGVHRAPLGSVTTASSGAPLPPVPLKWCWICWFVTQPSLPGTENFCLRALVAGPAEAMPTSVRITQKMTTTRLCASTQRVMRVIAALPPPGEVRGEGRGRVRRRQWKGVGTRSSRCLIHSREEWFREERFIPEVFALGYDHQCEDRAESDHIAGSDRRPLGGEPSAGARRLAPAGPSPACRSARSASRFRRPATRSPAAFRELLVPLGLEPREFALMRGVPPRKAAPSRRSAKG